MLPAQTGVPQVREQEARRIVTARKAQLGAEPGAAGVSERAGGYALQAMLIWAWSGCKS